MYYAIYQKFTSSEVLVPCLFLEVQIHFEKTAVHYGVASKTHKNPSRMPNTVHLYHHSKAVLLITKPLLLLHFFRFHSLFNSLEDKCMID